MYPGQALTVCCNMFNIMFILDLSRKLALYGEYHHDAHRPLLPTIVETEDGVKMARVLHYLVENYGRLLMIRFICGVSGSLSC